MILVLNAGSSSLKYRLVDPEDPDNGKTGLVEHIGEPGGVADHGAALAAVADRIDLDRGDIRAVGHRVVHGGAQFVEPTVIDDRVIAAIRELVPVAPLHNPANLAGIEVARRRRPDLPHVAVFDTAFHATLPAAAFTYALDASLAARHGIRRYGFHGTSCHQVMRRTAELLARDASELNMVVLHLGNGASATAIAGGRSVETSMGFSPLQGLVMGTRSGDIDPALPGHLYRVAGMAPDEVEDLLWHRSGLLGLCGDNDVRAVLERRAAGDAAARLAFDVYCHRIRSYVGAYHAVLGRLDAIAFTAGVGEHATDVRAQVLDRLDGWGIAVDPTRNAASAPGPRTISPAGARVAVCVVPSDEELAIAEETVAVLRR